MFRNEVTDLISKKHFIKNRTGHLVLLIVLLALMALWIGFDTSGH